MNSFEIKPYLLQNSIQHYTWGTKNQAAFIAELLGEKPEKDKPYAELWMGTHPNAASRVLVNSGIKLLPDFINAYPVEILGRRVAEKFNNKLPFLFKVLSAAEALSIQAHPNKKQAEVLHQKDPQHYPDDNHKPEIAIALDKLTAVIGFRPFAELLSVLEQFPPLKGFLGDAFCSEITQKFKNGAEESYLIKKLYSRLSDFSESKKAAFADMLDKISGQIETAEKTARDDLFLSLRSKYGVDIGLISIYMLNLVHLKKGQGVFLKAGVPHAYLKGNIVECMANSDNVVRAGLTPKFQDAQTLLDILTFEPGIPEIFDPGEDQNEFNYNVPVTEFRVKALKLEKEVSSRQTISSIQIMIVIDGNAVFSWNNQKLNIKKGQAVLIPAALESYQVNTDTNCQLYIAEAAC